MGFCALRRRFFGGFFLKFFGIFRKMVFFCDFSLLFLSLTDISFSHGTHGNAVALPACHSEFISPHKFHFLSPTDYTDLKDFYHPELTIRFFAAQKLLYGFAQIFALRRFSHGYFISPTDIFSLTESSFFYFPTNCTNVTNLFFCDYLWDLWAILIFFCLRQNGRTSRASLLS